MSPRVSVPISVSNDMGKRVMESLSATQATLARINAERRDAETKNQRLTRRYNALSQCNKAIVRCNNEQELFSQICRSVVAFGRVKMVWIYLTDELGKQLRPVASSDSGKEYLQRLQISVASDDPYGRGPSGMAFRENQPFWCQDFQHDPATAPWHERAVQFGWRASAALPLHRNGVVIGTFSLYADQINAFDKDLRNLLVELSTDIDYALNRFEERKKSDASLHKLMQAVEQSPNAIFITNLDANLEYANAAAVKNSGYSLEEIIGKNPRLQQSGKTPRATYDDMWAHLTRGESWQGEFINKRKDGMEHIDLVRISPVRETNGHITHYLAIEEDITEKKRSKERIHHLAHFDALTGLPNRALLDERANYALSLAKRSQDSLAVMFLDLDHFKNINDSLGHSVGDALLIELAKRLRTVLREDDTISRLGGDEFIMLLYGTSPRDAKKVAQKLQDAITQPYQIGQYDLNVTASIGIAIYPDDGGDLETLSRSADAAMYRAKQEGRNGYRFFTPEMQARSERHLELFNALSHALERDQLQLHYQPQVSLLDGHIIGAEALLRWHHPVLGTVSPAEFIPVAEESGLILPIGEWVLRTAVQQAKTWHDSGLGPLVMAVNLSTVQFRHADLPDLVMRILDEAGLPPEFLELELTEGVAMYDPQGAIAVMNNLHERGVRMAIDDFGTGFSSLNYLKKFKVHKLKIDQSFVRDISADAEDKAIVGAIIGMAKSLGLQTIAEGVETTAQLAYLREQGCNAVQGYYYSKPLPVSEFEAFLETCSHCLPGKKPSKIAEAKRYPSIRTA